MKINFIRTLILSAILCAVTVGSAWSGLLGITPGVPNITFVNTNSAATSYSPATGLVTITATPQLAMMISGSATVPVLPPRSLTIALQVDQSGNLVGGVVGDDLVLTGTVYGTSYAGTLLTGEIVGFGIQNSASTIDYIDLRLNVTGGSMASLFAGKDIGVSLAMENSTFNGSFDVSFQGAAKGNLGPIPPLQVCSGTIGDLIWNDANRNGIQDAGETGIDNVSVSLKDSSNTLVATKLSGPNGAYLFTGLCAGDYTVVVDTATLPAGFVASPILQGGDPVRDSNPNGAAVNLPSGTASELTIDFGYNSPCNGSIGDLVWHDQNRNGIQDPGEPGLGAITVNLIDSLKNTLITSTTTDGTGKYLFSGLCAGNYRVEAVAPAGFVLSTPLQGGNIASDSNPNPSEVVLASDYSGEVTIDFGFNTPCTGSIGDFVWNDLNRNGIQNSDEPGINNIRVWLKDSFSNLVATATTTGNGFYQFGGLCAGTYRVEVDNSTLPTGMVASPANATDGTEDSNNSPAAVILDADNSSDPTVDFGYYSPCSGSIGDMVWLDANRDGIQNFGETGINGVIVTLKDAANVVVAATTSGLGPLGQAGFYAFSGLCSGSYTVEVVTPAGLQISDSLQGGDPATDSNGSPASVYLDSDYSADPTIDFAFNPPCAGSIGNLVWDDLDRDGIQDPGEPGLDGVTVKLLTSANSQLSLTTTAGGGLYRFDGLCAGDYRVEVVPPAGRTASPVLACLNRELDSNPNPFAVNLPADTSSDQSIDFGFNTPCSGSIGNLVWHDKNRDGIQDELEPGISGASVKLKNASGTVIASTNTDQQGGYLFGGLCGGDYSVEVVTPAGFVPSSSFQGSNIALDSNGSPAQVSLAADGSSDRTIDFGFNTPCAAVIGDLVWNDLNQNGIQDSGEPGIAGVVVNLRDSQHTLLRTTNTKADGSYEFIGLCSGDYKIEALTPAGMTPTAVEAAGDPEKDSNSNPAAVTISSDTAVDTSIDFGFFKPCSICIDGVVYMTLKLEWRVATGDSGERIRVRADSITGQILYDSWFDSISGNGIPVGSDFGFSVPASAKQVVVTVQGQYHPSETQKAAFSAECDLLTGQINGNSYITFKVVDARFDGEKTCGTAPVIDVMKYASSDGKTWYRTDLDNVLKIALCSACEQDFDKDHCDYDHDGKCDEKDIDHCSNNPSDCDRHDRNRGGHGRSHRCDVSYDKTSCESRSREEHSRYEVYAGSGGTSASCGKVYYKFVVTDTGATALNDLTLVDSVHVTSSCAIPASLQPGGSFSCVIGPFQALAGQHSNIATASGTYMGVTATASDNAYYFGCSATVPKSPGYWKKHSEAWPVSSITIGGRSYTKSQAIALMNSSVGGDKTYTLFKALVAAKLNAMGCGDSSCVTETIAKAEAWMALHNVGSGVTGDSVAWKEAEPLYLILDDYDNGKACGAIGSVGGCNQTPEPPAPSTPTCGVCSGGVNRLTLMFKGWSTAMVTVKDSGGQTLYNANAAPNSSFSFTGKSSGGAMLQYVKIYVNGYHKATIYTDCSKSIYPGMGSGPFKVVEGYSLNGGKFCRIMSSACTSEEDHRHSKDYCDSHRGESSCTGFFNYNTDSGSRFGDIHLF